MKRETREVALELLVGRKVHDVDGRPVGRIEEVRAERIAEECYVREYLLGPAALLERLAVRFSGLRMARVFGIKPKPPRVASWELMVITNPEKPQLLCRGDQLPRDEA
jgi:hypothetical protein